MGVGCKGVGGLRWVVEGSLLVGIISLQLLLQSQDLLIPFVQAPSQRDHDVALFQQQLLVPIHLHIIGADLVLK